MKTMIFFANFAKPFANFAVKKKSRLNDDFLDCFAPLAMTVRGNAMT